MRMYLARSFVSRQNQGLLAVYEGTRTCDTLGGAAVVLNKALFQPRPQGAPSLGPSNEVKNVQQNLDFQGL